MRRLSYMYTHRHNRRGRVQYKPESSSVTSLKSLSSELLPMPANSSCRRCGSTGFTRLLLGSLSTKTTTSNRHCITKQTRHKWNYVRTCAPDMSSTKNNATNVHNANRQGCRQQAAYCTDGVPTHTRCYTCRPKLPNAAAYTVFYKRNKTVSITACVITLFRITFSPHVASISLIKKLFMSCLWLCPQFVCSFVLL